MLFNEKPHVTDDRSTVDFLFVTRRIRAVSCSRRTERTDFGAPTDEAARKKTVDGLPTRRLLAADGYLSRIRNGSTNSGPKARRLGKPGDHVCSEHSATKRCGFPGTRVSKEPGWRNGCWNSVRTFTALRLPPATSRRCLTSWAWQRRLHHQIADVRDPAAVRKSVVRRPSRILFFISPPSRSSGYSYE